jgi:FAD/FMN-containing dehydrogenase
MKTPRKWASLSNISASVAARQQICSAQVPSRTHLSEPLIVPDTAAHTTAQTAFGNRQASHAITLDGVWRPGEDFGDRDTTWTRRFFAALGRFREGVYVNFLGGDEDPDRVREAYGDSVYGRLVDVKTTYDPDNVFHHNQNIRPGTRTRISGASRACPH